MAEPATLNGGAAEKLQAALYHSRKRRRSRIAASPVNTVAPAISGTPTVGQTLTVSNGTWSGSPAFRYVWRRGTEIIAGASASSYTLVLADQGALITCTVIASNQAGSVGATSAAVGPIA
jgi:hypothetical protein